MSEFKINLHMKGSGVLVTRTWWVHWASSDVIAHLANIFLSVNLSIVIHLGGSLSFQRIWRNDGCTSKRHRQPGARESWHEKTFRRVFKEVPLGWPRPPCFFVVQYRGCCSRYRDSFRFTQLRELLTFARKVMPPTPVLRTRNFFKWLVSLTVSSLCNYFGKFFNLPQGSKIVLWDFLNWTTVYFWNAGLLFAV